MKKIFATFAICLGLLVLPGISQAAPLNWDFDGQLSSPSDLFHVQFELTEARTIVIYTTAGSHFDAGAFLWDENGNKLAANEDGYKQHFTYGDEFFQTTAIDAYIEITLQPGVYFMSLVSLIDGEYASSMNYETIWDLIAHREGKPAMDMSDFYDGTGIFGFHVLGVDWAEVYKPSAVPLPASALLLAPGIAALGMLRRRFK